MSTASGKTTILQDPEDSRNATFAFLEEDHTLGNVLRYMLLKHPKTHFCGYSIPHPSEAKMHFRLQSNDPAVPAKQLLREGIHNLQDMCTHIDACFTAALSEYAAAAQDRAAATKQSASVASTSATTSSTESSAMEKEQ